MIFKIVVLICCGGLLWGGAICDFKIQSATQGLEAFQNAKNKNDKKIKKAQDELNALKEHCDDDEIMADVKEHIKATKDKLDEAKHKLYEAYQSNDQHLIFQAKLQYKIAQTEYIAAKQEELRFKDLLKDNH